MQTVNRDKITFTELLAMEGVEERLELRGKVGFMSLHGGNLERLTDIIASEAALASNSSFYGVIQPSGLRHHLPSTTMDPAESERLATFIDHCEVVISVHGYGIRGRWTDLLLGGQNRELASHVAGHVRSAIPQYRLIDEIEDIPSGLRGLHAKNPCNLPASQGVQLELPPRVRGLTPLATHWPGSRPGRRFSHVNHLIEGLTAGAITWPG